MAAVFSVATVGSLVGPIGAPGKIVTGIPTVMINTKPVAVMELSMSSPHGAPPAVHSSCVSMGAANVLVNGDPLAFKTCTLLCEDIIMFGNPDMVFVGLS